MIRRRGRDERSAVSFLARATLLVLLATAAWAAIIASDFRHFLELRRALFAQTYEPQPPCEALRMVAATVLDAIENWNYKCMTTS
jgi:hypothetical protein